MADTRGPAEAGGIGPVPLRLELAIYGAATFSNSLGYMIMVVMPLWLVTLGIPPLMIGVILGVRHLLVLLFSIHGGAMMDRLDVRRVMLAFTWIGMLVPFAFPLLPYVWIIIILQMTAGYCTAAGWMGAQAIIGQTLKGSPVYTGRMSACVRAGALIGPPLAGAAWDFGGAWFAFATLALWGAGLFGACLALPAPKAHAGADRRISPGDFIPRWSDYAAAIALLAVPLIATVMMVAVLRIAGFAIQSTFYAVWLQSQGYTGTTIGMLMAVYSLFGGATALIVRPLVRVFRPLGLMIVMVGVCVVAIAVTPLLGDIWLLILAAAANGGAYGLSQPLMITLTARAAGPSNQGKAIGLRTTSNRLAATFMPVLMGAVVQVSGLEASFYVAGGAVLILLALAALYGRLSGAAREA